MDYTPHLTKRIGLFLLVLAAAIMMLTGCGGGGSSSGGGKETSAKPTSQLEKISSYVSYQRFQRPQCKICLFH